MFFQRHHRYSWGQILFPAQVSQTFFFGIDDELASKVSASLDPEYNASKKDTPLWQAIPATPMNHGRFNDVLDMEEREQIASEIDPAQQLSISFRTSSSWKQKIAFPLAGIKADQRRLRGISSWQEDMPI
ncbi:hypothetical protein [Endozoicomonas sp. ALB032]|uniref:hypothetical protein n=1 Tax=Endozoicomonas sp. ALB032 TaxID=3403082 RepID=UPI003BB4C03C